MSGWGTFCGDKGTQGLWPGPDQVRGAGPTDSLFQSSGLSVPQIPSSSPLQGGRLQGGTASRPAPSSGTRQPPWVWFWKGLGGATRGLSGLSCQPPKGGRSQPGGWRATPLRGWPCFRLPALAASLHPGAGGGGRGPFSKGLFPWRSLPSSCTRASQPLGLGGGCPGTGHRPWAGPGGGGQAVLAVSWPAAAPSPLPLWPQEAPAPDLVTEAEEAQAAAPGKQCLSLGSRDLLLEHRVRPEPRAARTRLRPELWDSGTSVGRREAVGPRARGLEVAFSSWSPGPHPNAVLPTLLSLLCRHPEVSLPVAWHV